jgi:hypothetical protein
MARTKKDNNDKNETTTKAPAKKKRTRTKAAPKANVAAVADAKENGEGSLGVKVWWDLWKVDGLRSELEEAFVAFGAEDCVPPDLTPVARMTYAMERMRSTCKVDFKRAGRENGWATFAAVKTAQTRNDEAKKDEHKASVDPQVVSLIAVNEETGKVSLQNPRCEIAKTVVKEYKRLETHFTSWELSNAVVAVVESLQGARLRLAGGLYYVPHPKDADERMDWETQGGIKMNLSKKIVALSEYVRTIGDCDFYIEEVVANSATARAAQNTTMHGLDKEFGTILKQATEFVDTLGQGESVSTRSLNAKIKAVKAIQGRAELFEEILAERGKRLIASAEVLQEALKGMVDGAAEVRKLEKVEGSDAAQEVAQRLAGELAGKARAELDRVLEAAAPPAPAANGEDVAEAKAS